MGAELVRRLSNRPVQDDGLGVVEGVGKGELGVQPGEVVLLEGERAEDGRGGAHGEGARADVVVEAGEGELGGGAGAAEGGVGLEDFDGEAGAREDGGGGEAVGAGADDDCSLRHVSLPLRQHKLLRRQAVER